jgi:hypothetical protein
VKAAFRGASIVSEVSQMSVAMPCASLSAASACSRPREATTSTAVDAIKLSVVVHFGEELAATFRGHIKQAP